MSTSPIHPAQFRLARVQVVNWGTLHGFHDVPVARKGFLITGASGSGKSTLIDAISTVLMPGGSVRFNAAAQESTTGAGRNFVSYIRGAWRREADADTDALTSSYLRTGATWSAVALTYRTGDDTSPVTLIKLMYLKRGANTNSDVSVLHLILDADVRLTEFEPFVSRGIDTRAIRKNWPDATVNPSYSPFARAFRNKLGISSEAAQHLLHRTLSAKSLGSLDQLLRDYMLDEPGTFDIARRATEQFRDLNEAHRVVIDARRQVETLDPLVALANTRTLGLHTQRDLQDEADHLDAVHTEMTVRLLTERVEEATAQTSLLEAAADKTADEAKCASEHTVELRARLEGAGDGQLATLRLRRNTAEETRERISRQLRTLEQALTVWDAQTPTTAAEFAHLRAQIDTELRDLDARAGERRTQLHSVIADVSERQALLRTLVADRETLAKRRSNLDTQLLRARELICAAAGLTEDALPFAGESIEVLPEHAEWTGAIERVLGGFGRTLLVPDELHPRVAAAIDAQHLGARLVYRRVRLGATPKDAPSTSNESLVRKLDVQAGSFTTWIRHHLADRFDYACVDTADDLRRVTRGVTRAGQVKHGGDRFEKDDRFRVDDRSRWVLGFDNEAKLVALRDRIVAVESEVGELARRRDRFEHDDTVIQQRRHAAGTVHDTAWADVDIATADASLATIDERLQEWLRGNTEYSVLTAALERAETEAQGAQDAQVAARSALESHRNELTALTARLDEVRAEVVDDAPAEVARRIRDRFQAVARRVTHDNIDRALHTVGKAIGDEQRRAAGAISDAERDITRILTAYLAEWEARRAEMRADAEFVDEALAVLSRLRTDGLPAYEDEFFRLLSDQSHRNIGELTRAIQRAPGEIRSRIDPVNESLRHSPFDTDRILRIDVKDRRSATASEFLAELVSLMSGSWKEEDRTDAERRFERMAAVLERLDSGEPADVRWRRLVLDTRLHVGFIGVEVDLEGNDTNYHDSSSGLSGGQAQKLVFFCLAAALRYQLAPAGAELPRYGTVILDEAFDRADPAYTRRALDVFTQFGFHMVLATPLKLLQTLDDYVDGVATVSIRDKKYSQLALLPIHDAGEAQP
ncbi:ATP-binding protein [Rhodococcus artemisiae]|uniref:ATP-binding protein n=1 Tax=Rhodococcus artemisiae TaxID=714159 RepID=A0ABU7LIW5_9NOCA|nr:ATP-binding protein [Rhodococcus artemisiae]MEE2061451.1 ATP-binding protein [Rhodococcus artemisiae]